jgi:RNA polymerase sigma factor (sigma-70 family)
MRTMRSGAARTGEQPAAPGDRPQQGDEQADTGPAEAERSGPDPRGKAVADLVLAAGQGDQTAWERLVDRFAGLIWAVARAHGLSTTQAADVSQVTWLRLVEHLGSLRDPEHVGAWLATTARREALRTLRSRSREAPSADVATEGGLPAPPPDLDVLLSERDAVLWRAFEELPPRCQRLLRLLLTEPPPGYTEIAAALGMRVGSIGPTRARCLGCLRRNGRLATYRKD